MSREEAPSVIRRKRKCPRQANSGFWEGNYPGEGKYDWRYIPRVNEGTYYVNTTKTSNVSIVYDGRGTKDVGTGFGVRA